MSSDLLTQVTIAWNQAGLGNKNKPSLDDSLPTMKDAYREYANHTELPIFEMQDSVFNRRILHKQHILEQATYENMIEAARRQRDYVNRSKLKPKAHSA